MASTYSYNLYEEAQILLAAVRLFRHRERRPPSIQELAEWSCFSIETVHHICNRLQKIGAMDRIRGAFEDHICLKDPMQVEALREVDESPDIEADVKKWKEQLRREKEDRFSKIEEKLRKGGKQEAPSPLDALFRKDLGKKESS
jgi:hypothetical protein